MEQKIIFQLETERDEVKIEEEAANTIDAFEIQDIQSLEKGQTPGLVEASFVDPVTIVAAATIAVITERLVKHWLRGREQGVQIDLSKKTPVISRLAGVPLGFIVIINKDGTASTHKADYSEGDSIGMLLQTIFTSQGK